MEGWRLPTGILLIGLGVVGAGINVFREYTAVGEINVLFLYSVSIAVVLNPLVWSSLLGAFLVKQEMARQRQVGATVAQVTPPPANRDDWISRQHEAAHPGTSEKRLRDLAEDEKPAVRLAVTRNPLATSGVLQHLLSDSNETVRKAANRRLLQPDVTSFDGRPATYDPNPPAPVESPQADSQPPKTESEPVDNVLEQLERAKSLLESGSISPEEFQSIKGRIIDN